MEYMNENKTTLVPFNRYAIVIQAIEANRYQYTMYPNLFILTQFITFMGYHRAQVQHSGQGSIRLIDSMVEYISKQSLMSLM